MTRVCAIILFFAMTVLQLLLDCIGVIRETATVKYAPFHSITWIDSFGVLEANKSGESCFLLHSTPGHVATAKMVVR